MENINPIVTEASKAIVKSAIDNWKPKRGFWRVIKSILSILPTDLLIDAISHKHENKSND